MTNTKITQRDQYNATIAILEAVGTEEALALVDFHKSRIEALDKKAAKAKETAGKKKAEADPLMEVVESVLTDELTTIPDVTAAAADIDANATTSKVTYRLNALVEAGKAIKDTITIPAVSGGKARRVNAYKRA